MPVLFLPNSRQRSEHVIDKRLLLVLAPAVLLGACDNSPAETSATPGEVLEGTISDAMLPVDQVRSEPPLEDPAVFEVENAEGRPGTADGAAPAGGEGAAEESEHSADEGGSEGPTPAAAPAQAPPAED
jgi:hypothetical protein